MRTTLAFLALALLAAHAPGAPNTWTLENHAGDYTDELVRLKIAPPAPYDARRLVVAEDGKPVPCQVEVLEGSPEAVQRAHIWVLTTIPAKGTHTYKVTVGGKPPDAPPRVRLTRDGHDFVLDNGALAVKVPAEMDDLRGPVTALRLAGGWVGASEWRTGLALKAFRADVVADGTLFAMVRLRYDFQPTPDLDAPFAEITVRLAPGHPFARIEESHQMPDGDAWVFGAAEGWQPSEGLVQGWFLAESAFAQPNHNGSLRTASLAPNPRLGETVTFLQPRWTQSADAAWLFAATDGKNLVAAFPARAGKWEWPYDNRIEVRVDASGRKADLVCPTPKGRRWWLLAAGPRQLADSARNLVTHACFQPLDKLTNEYDLDWPGQPPGGFNGLFFYDDGQANPTSMVRRVGRSAVDDALAGKLKGNRGLLSSVQVYFDPDFFAYYHNHWSPINPNFSTDMLKIPVARTAGLKAHPRFNDFARMAQDAFRMDLFYAVTLPGGAGQESPGYTSHAMSGWFAMADVCRKHLGFDPANWPRFKAAASFLLHTSQPLGGGKRRILPLGDTHPTGPDVFDLARRAGANERVERFTTEELPGFGVVFRSHPGAANENFLAFKAGPNRGHNHGDQLSFHYCGQGRRLAIDHMCSYSPRAPQEHMHNRVAFGDFENMDGYERLVAFRASPLCDVAVAQVESRRLRKMFKTPQETIWQARYERRSLDVPLVYRRTVVFVKNPAAGRAPDYFVIRDQAAGPDLKATYCLHVEGDTCARKGQTIDFGSMTLFCAAPPDFQFERFDWSFTKGKGGYSESTAGARLATRGPRTEFVTVLYPSGNPPKMESIPGGVRLCFPAGQTDEVTFADPPADDPDAPLVTLTRAGKPAVALAPRDVDLNRSQGEVGLFVPEAGYDFGPIPDWLIRQREKQVLYWNR